MRLKSLVVGFLSIGLLFALACGSAEEPTPTPSAPTATAQPGPTAIPTPTTSVAQPGATATPTTTVARPGPTATPTPTPAPTGEKPKYGGVLRFPHYIRTLDVGGSEGHNWGDLGMTTNLYTQLVRFNITDRQSIEPDLAESWTVSEDGLTYAFKLRSGVVDHEGASFGAEQAAYQFYRYAARPGGMKAPRQGCWKTALGTKLHWPPQAGDAVTFNAAANTVTFLLPAKRGWFLNCVAMAWSQIGPTKKYIPIDQAGKYRELDPTKGEIVGAGSFKLKSYAYESKMEVERNPNYFRKGLPYLDGVQVFQIQEPSAQVAAMMAGQVDGVCCNQVPGIVDAVALKKRLGDKVVVPETVGFGWAGVLLNVARKPLGPVNDPTAKTIRKAIQLAVDRDALNDFIYQGGGFPSFYYFYGWDWIYSREQWEQMPGFNPKTKAQDIAEAKRLMESLGYGPKNMLSVEWVGTDREDSRLETQVWAEQLKAIYINLDARFMAENSTTAQEGKFDMNPSARGYAFEDPEIYDSSMYLPIDKYATFNYGRWENAEYLKLYEQQLPITDLKQRGAILRQMADILYNDAAFIPSVRKFAYNMYRGNWRGWTPPRIHVANLSLENVWLSTDEKATPEILQKYDVFVKKPQLLK